ncbi:MAG: hypothetical protein KAX13_10010, partial [Candidatus Krumholzibacteria bacterium]|nr:hypothetical protein [Candidatus Krumholzibacteria bacterium]
DDGSTIPIVETRHRIEFVPGFREYTKMEMLLKDASGEERNMIVKPISLGCYMSGGGYDDLHGLDRGTFHVEGERWDVSQPVGADSPLFGQYQRDAELQLDAESGVGLIEASFGRAEAWQYEPSW